MEDTLFDTIGLTGSERKVYIALLELGDSSRQKIVQQSGIAGSKIYEILERLQEKGLVSIYVKDRIKHFKPTNPNQIIHYLEEKKESVIEVEKQAKLMLPALLAKFNSSHKDQEVELLSGIRGLQTIFYEQVDLLEKGDTCYVIGGTRGIDEGAVMAFFQKIHSMRLKKGIKTRMIYNLRQKKETETLFGSKVYAGTATRYIPHTSPVAINIYKDRTVIIIFGSEITSIYIKSQEVANSFMEYFDILWKQSVA